MESIQGILRGSLQNLLLNRMIRTVGREDGNWKVLVVDRSALRILAAALHVNELVNERVSIIELIDMRREPLPRTPAIYFISPTPESVEQLVSESSKQYRSFHVFFTGRLPDYLLGEIRAKPEVLRKIRSLVELNVQLLALESRLFSLDRPAASLPQLHTSSDAEAREELSTLSERLCDACMLLAPDVDWKIRSDAMSSHSRTVATFTKEHISSMQMQRPGRGSNGRRDTDGDEGNAADDAELPPQSSGSYIAPRKATLLVVDRVADLASPLLHEFTYQAMAHDLLPLNYQKPGGAHVEIETEEESADGKAKFEQLDEEEKDPIWNTVRWTFIEEALQKAQAALREFIETDAGYKVAGKSAGEIDVREMGEAVRALPESKKRANKYAMHIKCARDCLAVCEKQGLTNLSLVEQDLAIGVAPDGTKLKSEAMLDRIADALRSETTPVAHRVRLLILSVVVAEGLTGLGGENSALAFSPNYRQRMLRSGLPDLLDLSSEHDAALRGARLLLERARIAKDTQMFKDSRKPRMGGGSANGSGAGGVAGDDDELGADTVTARLRQRYNARQARKENKRLRAERHRRHGLQQDDELHYDVARYHPPLRSVMMELVDEELDEQAFPTSGEISVGSIIAGSTSSIDELSGGDGGAGSGSSHRLLDRLRSPGGHGTHRGGATRGHSRALDGIHRERSAAMTAIVQSFGRSSSGSIKSDDSAADRRADSEHLYVVFVIGGVSYSEARAMYEVCAKREANIVVGGSSVLTPRTYLDALSAVADPVLRIKVMLPALPLELAQTRAARALVEQAEREAEEQARAEAAANSSSTGADSSTGAGRDGEGGADEVHIVTSYKKKRGLRLFGKRK